MESKKHSDHVATGRPGFLTELFPEAPEFQVASATEETGAGWVDTADPHAVLSEARRYVLSRIGQPPKGSFLGIQAALIDAMFESLQNATDRDTSQDQVGLALVNLLSRISHLMNITSIAAADRGFDQHLGFLQEASDEGRFTLTTDKERRTFVAMRGRKPTSQNQEQYNSFDSIKNRELERTGVELRESQVVKLFEKEAGRKFGFTDRKRLIVRYRTRNRRSRKPGKK